jgi:predicted DNA-binding WGR domain protein
MRLGFDLVRRLIREALLNAYDVLGVPPGSPDDVIKSAWKKLALQHHPDRGGSHGKMVDINNAKDRLLDKTQLYRYGNQIKGYEDPNAPRPAAPPPRAEPNKPSGRYGDPQDFWRDYVRSRGGPPGSQSRPGPTPNAGPPPTPNIFSWRYFEFSEGTSRKFWEIKVTKTGTVDVRWGRIGAEGQSQTKTFPGEYTALRHARKLIRSKRDKGYQEVTRPASRTGGAPQPQAARPAPGPRPTSTGGPKSYKVYGNVRGKKPNGTYTTGWQPHTRVKGQAYAKTSTPASKFNKGDQVNVNIDPQTHKAKVSGKIKDRGGAEVDHSQDWDEITQEARRLIDETVIEVLYERAFRR